MSMKKAAGYIRRSSSQQKDNDSFEIQKLAITEFAKRAGYVLADEFIFEDDAVSAYKKSAYQRRGLMLLKKTILENDFDAVIFYDFSRIDRKVYSFVSEFYYDVIQAKPHLKFYSTTKGTEWSPEDLDVKLFLILANAESMDKARRTIDSHHRNLKGENKKRPGACVPYGYDVRDKVLVPNQYASIILFIFYLASWGHSMKSIASLLNEVKIESPRNGVWRSSTVEHILKNPAYLGHLAWDMEHTSQMTFFYENVHEPIVPFALHKVVQMNNELKKKYHKLDTPFIFADLLYCKTCKQQLQHRNASTKKAGKSYTYMKYQCTHCQYELDTKQVNAYLLKDLEHKLQCATKFRHKEVIKDINATLKVFHSRLSQLKEKKERIEYNEQHAHNLDNADLLIAVENAKQQVLSEFQEVNLRILEMELLLRDSELNVFLERFERLTLNSLSNTENRLITLYFIQRVSINKQGRFSVEYSINPLKFLYQPRENSIG
ncbi:recombinase family protein [Bacillus sp. 165]|uniref:recombinase family protein n=1 Tax=Bacillus sp. 165 TaxID=1529117 RepID=UPI001AD9E7F4|nr:recombinase family protein [Bacillus sp. 165]MBO9128505.1 recombinase family protein [Bacillus sp. 165]